MFAAIFGIITIITMKRLQLLPLLILLAFPLWSQERPLNTGLSLDEQYALVGMTLTELLDRFGPPRMVVASRGYETWQDDVVFQYTGVDFYIFRDRVWQVRFVSMHGISIGDTRAVVLLTLGDAAEDRGSYALMPVIGRGWPLRLRVNFNSAGRVHAIFLYRPDF